jgi:exonuclease SbcD
MKIAHMSDLHYAGETLEEVDRCFGHAVSQAIAQDVDVAIITGDSTDHAMNAHAPAIRALAAQVKRLADHCPVLMLQGTFSHEPPGMLALFGLIGAKNPIAIADRISQLALRDGMWEQSVSDRFDPPPVDAQFVVTAIPTVNKAVLAGHVGADKAADELGNALFNVLASYAPSHVALRQAGVPTMLISHGTVNGCETEHGVPMVGLDHEFTIGGLFIAETDMVGLGHIHKHQSWQKGRQVAAYAGSIGRLHYGEVDEKVFLVWNGIAGGASFVAHPVPARKMVDILFDGFPDMDVLRQKADEIEGQFVRIRYSVDKESRDAIDRAAIETLFAKAAGLKIEGRILPPERVRTEGISGNRSLMSKLSVWGQATGTDVSHLEERLGMLESMEPEGIIEDLMRPDQKPQMLAA